MFSSRFSSRLSWDRPENALAALERSRRGGGRGPLLDLTESNPTRVGLPYPTDDIAAALAASAAGGYTPSARGLPEARAAVAAAQASAGTPLDAAQLMLTASSSESYAFLFKLLCDPGEAVLVPEPSYPLFEYLARLEGVVPVAYRLAYDGAWHIDFASVDAALARAASAGARPRALVVVSPNNPTGSYLKRFELEPLARACTQAGLAAISDEVFAAYPSGPDPARVTALAAERSFTERVLTFSLGGLSKACGLPQLKMGWMAVAGPTGQDAAALARLELIADTYLSVGTPVQVAAARLLQLGGDIQRAISGRVDGNRARLRGALPTGAPCTLLASEGGWSAILRVPATSSDEDWASALLAEDGVLVHPGYFFDIQGGTFLIISLLPPPVVFDDGVGRLLSRVGGSGIMGA